MTLQVIERSTLNLPEKLIPLIASIEEAFSRPVVFAMVDDLLHAEAYGGLDDNGTPIVGMMLHGCREITIVHELLHLECEAQGFPRTRSKGGTAKLPPEKVFNLIGEWFSIVEHQVIYPKMENLGYDPSEDIESKVRNGFLSALKNRIEFRNNNPDRDILFADLVTQTTRVMTEGRRPLRRQLTKIMQDSFPEELELSVQLADQIKSVNIWTPQEVKVMAEKCLAAIGIPKVGIYSYIEPDFK